MPLSLREDELDEIILRAIRHGGRETLAFLEQMEKKFMSEFDDISARLDDVSAKEDANAKALADIQAAGAEIDGDIKDAISLIQQTNASVITEAQLGAIRDKLTAIQGKVAANTSAAASALSSVQSDDAEWKSSQVPTPAPTPPADPVVPMPAVPNEVVPDGAASANPAPPVNPDPAPVTQPGVNSDAPGAVPVDPEPTAAPIVPGSGASEPLVPNDEPKPAA